MNNEQIPTAQDLAAKFKVLTPEEKAAGAKAIKQTERNGICPCGCGNKAKKCINGRRVLAFKRFMP